MSTIPEDLKNILIMNEIYNENVSCTVESSNLLSLSTQVNDKTVKSSLLKNIKINKKCTNRKITTYNNENDQFIINKKITSIINVDFCDFLKYKQWDSSIVRDIIIPYTSNKCLNALYVLEGDFNRITNNDWMYYIPFVRHPDTALIIVSYINDTSFPLYNIFKEKINNSDNKTILGYAICLMMMYKSTKYINNVVNYSIMANETHILGRFRNYVTINY